jgi:hypothetical protein
MIYHHKYIKNNKILILIDRKNIKIIKYYFKKMEGINISINDYKKNDYNMIISIDNKNMTKTMDKIKKNMIRYNNIIFISNNKISSYINNYININNYELVNNNIREIGLNLDNHKI